MSDLNSVVLSKKVDGSWQALHVPSGKFAFGETPTDAEEDMRKQLGMDESGEFSEPLTSAQFAGVGKDIAEFLEGEVSAMLAAHAGFARLEAFEAGVAHVRLGGGCTGCPSSQMTLVGGVLVQLQERFGDDVVTEVQPVP